MTAAPARRPNRVVGYLLALGAGATWGTTGPLSTGLYDLMPATSIGFWRVLIGTIALAIWGILFRRELFKADRRAWLLVGLGGGAMVALFEIAYQFAIGGVGVAGAAALLYTAPVIVAVLARLILKEALTPTRIALAFLVMVGVALTVTGGSNAGAEAARMGVTAGIAGGLLSALSYALTSLMGRYAAPRYGVGVDLGLAERLTAAVAVLGRHPLSGIERPGFFNVTRCVGRREFPAPLFGIRDRRPDIYDVSIGGRVNLWRDTLIGFVNALVPLNADGFRAEVIPLAGLEATF